MEGENSSAPSLSSTNAGSNSGKKKTRGSTKNLKLISLPRGHKLPLSFNSEGQAVGQHATMFSSNMGRVVRCSSDVPINNKHWIDISDDKREKHYKLVVDKFDFVETPLIKEKIVQKMEKKYRDYKSKLKRDYYDVYEADEDRIANCPPNVPLDQWRSYVLYLGTPDAKKLCARNKANRAKQDMSHTAGTKSFAIIRDEQTQKDPNKREPSKWKIFNLTHKRKDGSIVDGATREIFEKFENLSSQVKEDSDSSSTMNEDEIFAKVMGPERHGRVRGYGLGPTPTSVFGSTSSRVELLQQMEDTKKTMNEKMEEMERRMKEESKKREEERKIMEEERKLIEEERKTIQEERNRMFAFMEEIKSRQPNI